MLRPFGVSYRAVVRAVTAVVGVGDAPGASTLDLAESARQALRLALAEATPPNQPLIDSGALLLGLLHVKDRVLQQVLAEIGVAPTDLRLAALRWLRPGPFTPPTPWPEAAIGHRMDWVKLRSRADNLPFPQPADGTCRAAGPRRAAATVE